MRYIAGLLNRAVGTPAFWVIFVFAVIAFPVSRALTRAVPKPPKVLMELPAFALTDQLGKSFGSRELEGRVWVANFVFTRCPTRCASLTEEMGRLQKRLRSIGDAVYLVSFSVDPEHDSPETLEAYAREHHVNYRRWRFLTGNLDLVRQAVIDGFKMPIDPGPAGDGDGVEDPEASDVDSKMLDITHGTRFVLVDRRMRIRGYYEADEEGTRDLLRDLSMVASFEIPPPPSPVRDAPPAPSAAR